MHGRGERTQTQRTLMCGSPTIVPTVPKSRYTMHDGGMSMRARCGTETTYDERLRGDLVVQVGDHEFGGGRAGRPH